MTREVQDKVMRLETASRKIKEALDIAGEVWGVDAGVFFRGEHRVAFARLADAMSLAERGVGKLQKAIDALKKPVQTAVNPNRPCDAKGD